MSLKIRVLGALTGLGLLVGACVEPAIVDGTETAPKSEYREAVEAMGENGPLANGAISETAGTGSDYLAEYFPGNVEFDPDLPAPHSILGFAPGEIHVTPEALHGYLQTLAAVSSRTHMETIGYTHEKRQLAHIYLSSPENIADLEGVRQRHLNATGPDQDILVLKLAYSVHGNEPSGANAVPLIAYYLAASQDPWIEAFLARTVVIIEPVQNPDGLTRFAQWANTHRSQTINWDDAQRNHFASWPSGRTNHYWFDLNRDWIFTVHPESKARIEQYHRWKPHVLGDYHEMGGDKPSYFFQPGHPKRTHPLTLEDNQKLTAGLAAFHADALDKAGQDYYSRERFDDFYYGKGSAYPDITGGIGLLFEQTAVRGQARDFDGEHLTFPQSIANQVTTSFSLMRGSDALREDVMRYRFTFQEAERRRAANAQTSGYVFSDSGDPARAHAMIELLARHHIAVHDLTRAVTRNGVSYEPGHAWIVPVNAQQFGLVTSLFETRTEFEDNVFYDVSTWNLPTAFNLDYAALNTTGNLLGEVVSQQPAPTAIEINSDAVAYAIPWNQLHAPKMLQAILDEGLFPRVSALPFGVDLIGGERHIFERGTVTVRLRNATSAAALQRAATRVPGVNMLPLSSGMTFQGPDLGSRDMDVVYPVQLAMIVGGEVSSTQAGALWYFLDARLGVAVTLLDHDRVASTDLDDYTHILMVGGEYAWPVETVDHIMSWTSQGGILVAQKQAAEWVQGALEARDGAGVRLELLFPDGQGPAASEEAEEEEELPDYKPYQDYELHLGNRLLSGSVFRTEADLTHPFAFGFNQETVHLFRTWNQAITRGDISYDTPFRYADQPLVSGFVSAEKLEELKGTPAVAAHRIGRGHVITLADDLVFRGIWRGSERIYANIIYFTQTIGERSDD